MPFLKEPNPPLPLPSSVVLYARLLVYLLFDGDHKLLNWCYVWLYVTFHSIVNTMSMSTFILSSVDDTIRKSLSVLLITLCCVVTY